MIASQAKVPTSPAEPDWRLPLHAEIRVLKTDGHGWRWDVTWQEAIDARLPGVFDCRTHQRADFGYTRTRWGAWRRVRHAYEKGKR